MKIILTAIGALLFAVVIMNITMHFMPEAPAPVQTPEPTQGPTFTSVPEIDPWPHIRRVAVKTPPKISNSTIRRCYGDRQLYLDAADHVLESRELVAAMIAQSRQESGCRDQISSKYAHGRSQFTISTAKGLIRNGQCVWFGRPTTNSGIKRLTMKDVWAARCQDVYMRQLMRFTGKLFTDDLSILWSAFDAYNGGPGWIKRERTKAIAGKYDVSKYSNYYKHVCLRAAWACKENKGYGHAILTKWVPQFKALGVPHADWY